MSLYLYDIVKFSLGAMEIEDEDVEPAHKRQRLEVTGGESVDSGGKFS